jgi:hypothetical protein
MKVNRVATRRDREDLRDLVVQRRELLQADQIRIVARENVLEIDEPVLPRIVLGKIAERAEHVERHHRDRTRRLGFGIVRSAARQHQDRERER